MTGPASPSINGVPVPLGWHLTPAQVRHYCGSAERVELAREDAEHQPRRSAFAKHAEEILPGVFVGAAPLQAPGLAPLLDAVQEREATEAVFRAVQEAGRFGTTVARIRVSTGFGDERTRRALRRLRECGELVAEEHMHQPWVWRTAAAIRGLP